MVGAVLLSDDGELRIESSRPFGGNWLMRFVGVDTRERAEALRGHGPPGPSPRRRGRVVGARAHRLRGVRRRRVRLLGTVSGVLANPASDLLELDGGALVPLRFVVERSAGRVVVEVPAGLLDLPRP